MRLVPMFQRKRGYSDTKNYMAKLTEEEIAAKLADLNKQISAQLPSNIRIGFFRVREETQYYQFHRVIGG